MSKRIAPWVRNFQFAQRQEKMRASILGRFGPLGLRLLLLAFRTNPQIPDLLDKGIWSIPHGKVSNLVKF